MAFDDDDSPLTTHTVGPSGAAGVGNNDDAPTMEEALEDEMPDFKLFGALTGGKKAPSAKTIRRGEKDFEEHGTRAQDSALESSRQAMEEVLSHTRAHRKDVWVRAWYFPDHWAGEKETTADSGEDDLKLRERVVVVEHEKGSWMKDIGRVIPLAKDSARVARLWLLPEEALYLVERGTLDLWWPDRPLDELLPPTTPLERGDGFGPDDYDVGIPLSLEAAYAMLIGNEGERGKITLPKYQVYTHLKRSGLRILRAPAAPSIPKAPATMLWQWLFSFIRAHHEPKVANAWGPLVQPGLYRAYRPIYQRLAIIPRHTPTENPPATTPEPEDPYRVFYHVWKASGGSFSKKSPPPPDFRIAVADTEDTFVPDLQQLDALLLSSAPYDPPSRRPEWQAPGRMYQRLKHGHRSILVAVVDRGLVNFMRFGEGAFGEEKLFERFDGGEAAVDGGEEVGGVEDEAGGGGEDATYDPMLDISGV
ncbi:tRNA-splicing endonuclease subunit sen54 [Amphichorda felina]